MPAIDSSITASVAALIQRTTGTSLDQAALENIVQVAAGVLPEIVPRSVGAAPGAPALGTAAAAVEAAFAPRHGDVKAADFPLVLGVGGWEERIEPRCSTIRSLAITGAFGSGKGVYSRFLLQQLLAHGWQTLIVSDGAWEWSGFGPVLELPRGRDAVESFIRDVIHELQVMDARPGSRLAVVVDGIAIPDWWYGLQAQCTRHAGLLICVTPDPGEVPIVHSGGDSRQYAHRRQVNDDSPGWALAVDCHIHISTDYRQQPADGSRLELRLAAAFAWRYGRFGIFGAPCFARPSEAKPAGRAVRRMLAMRGIEQPLNFAYTLVAMARGYTSWHALCADIAREGPALKPRTPPADVEKIGFTPVYHHCIAGGSLDGLWTYAPPPGTRLTEQLAARILTEEAALKGAGCRVLAGDYAELAWLLRQHEDSPDGALVGRLQYADAALLGHVSTAQEMILEYMPREGEAGTNAIFIDRAVGLLHALAPAYWELQQAQGKRPTLHGFAAFVRSATAVVEAAEDAAGLLSAEVRDKLRSTLTVQMIGVRFDEPANPPAVALERSVIAQRSYALSLAPLTTGLDRLDEVLYAVPDLPA